MLWKKGDIWFWHKLGHYIVIPTNAGWKADGANVMGTGLAKDASKKFVGLSYDYGEACKHIQAYVWYPKFRLILVPTKRLNEAYPYLSWKNDSDLEFVRESLQWLQDNTTMKTAIQKEGVSIYVPLLGAGSGHLPAMEVKHAMDQILTDPIFVGVTKD